MLQQNHQVAEPMFSISITAHIMAEKQRHRMCTQAQIHSTDETAVATARLYGEAQELLYSAETAQQ